MNRHFAPAVPFRPYGLHLSVSLSRRAPAAHFSFTLLSFNSSTNIMEYHVAIDFVLYKNSNNTYTLYTADGTKYVYAGLKLSTVSSPNSVFDTLIFSYNVSPGYITQIRDAEGQTATFSYNSNNTLASITLGSQTRRYTYKGSSLSLGLYPVSSYTWDGFIGLIGEFAGIFRDGEEYEE